MAKEIPLTQGKVAIVDDEDFEILNKYTWSISNGYATRRLKRAYEAGKKPRQRDQKMHRLLMGEPIGLQIDHINNNKLDNRRLNLRLATARQNRQNKPSPKLNTSGYKGVSFCKITKKWVSQIKTPNGAKYLGRFLDPRTAALKYDHAAEKYHGEFANINFKPRHQL